MKQTSVKVIVSHLTGKVQSKTLEKTINVYARDWSLPWSTGVLFSDARLRVGRDWGAFFMEEFVNRRADGSGPWNGLVYVGDSAGYGLTSLEIHPDLQTVTAGGYLADATLLAGCPNLALSRGTLYWINAGGHGVAINPCATFDAYNTFRQRVIAHEQRHQTLYNNCAFLVSEKMQELEGWVGLPSEVTHRMIDDWTARAFSMLYRGAAGDSPAWTSADFWIWKPGWIKEPVEIIQHWGACTW